MTTRCSLLVALLALLAAPASAQTPRPLPHPVFTPPAFADAVARGTRTETGEPGPAYWQQRADYDLTATLDPTTNELHGTASIRYQNNSPDTLQTLVLKLRQNLHQAGVPRNRPVEVTGGMTVADVQVGGRAYPEGSAQWPGQYALNGTLMALRLAEPLLPGAATTVSMDFRFQIPAAGAPRMGQDGEVYYLGYWYPQMAVYDDVTGWDTDPYLGTAEHYMGWGDYDVQITVPEGWIVHATGELQNTDEVLTETIRQRLAQAAASDEIVHVLTAEERQPGLATATSDDGTLTWHFTAENVRDFAFGTSAQYIWDATRANVGDRDGDGQDDFAMIHAIYRPEQATWRRSVEFAKFSIEHLSELFFPYPYPHMTTVEGLIGGGMEYPMITLIGSSRSDRSLFGVTYHEIAHMWFPMIVGQNETAFTWMDEGLVSYNTNVGTEAFWGPEARAWENEYHYFLAGTGLAVEPARHGDQFPISGPARVVAAYSTPVVLLRAIEGIYGADRFWEAYRTYAERWAFKHPYPDDLFNTFEDVLGEDLDWLWTPTLFETWTVDQAVASVEPSAGDVVVRIQDLGLAPMPAPVVVTYTDGRTERQTIPVATWLSGATEASLTFPGGEVARVEIDPEMYLPDVDRSNNTYDISTQPSGTH